MGQKINRDALLDDEPSGFSSKLAGALGLKKRRRKEQDMLEGKYQQLMAKFEPTGKNETHRNDMVQKTEEP